MAERKEDLTVQKFVGTSELAEAAARLVSQFIPEQHRGSVSEFPDERTVRYYLTQSLLSEPDGRQGTASVFGYRHLLELLVIKRLQAANFRIRQIREMLTGKDIAQLEAILDSPETQLVKEKNEKLPETASGYLESLLSKPKETESGPLRTNTLPLNSGILAMIPNSAWTRLEIEPGLEIHLRGDWELPSDHHVRQRLGRRMLDALTEASQHRK